MARELRGISNNQKVRQPKPEWLRIRLGDPARLLLGLIFSLATVLLAVVTGRSGLTFAPDGRLFVVDKPGLARIVKNGVLLTPPLFAGALAATSTVSMSVWAKRVLSSLTCSGVIACVRRSSSVLSMIECVEAHDG